MIPFRRVGYFSELVRGAELPSLSDARGRLPGEFVPNMVAYLRSGTLLAPGGGAFNDVLDPARQRVVPTGLFTDGTWLWRSDLAYYVERYQVGLPLDLIEHARQQSWRAPPIPEREFEILEARSLLPGPFES